MSYLFAFSYCSCGSQGKSIEVVCHSLLHRTTFCQNSPPWLIRLGWSYMARLIVSLSYTRLWSMWSHLNAQFQRIARRDKKDFLSNQCKEKEENNRMGKSRDLFQKIRDTKWLFHAKMGIIKDRYGMYLIEAEDIKKGWQQYIEQLYKKDLYDPDNHNGVITHLEPDILEYEVKWALGSITTNKASGGDRIPVELFQILKDAVKVLHSVCQQIWKTQHWLQDWKMSVFIPIPKKGNAKECSNYCTVALISH